MQIIETREQRQKIKNLKKVDETLATVQDRTPEEQKKLDDNIKKRNTKYNRRTGKLELIEE